MAKTITDITVKRPEQFDANKLAEMQEARVAGYLRSPISKKQITAFTFIEFMNQYDELVSEGYARDTESATLFTNPFVCYLHQPLHLLETEIERIKSEVEAEYRADLAKQVENARAALIQQRLAFFEEQEKKKEEEKKAKLLRELEKEATDLFKHSV